MNVSKLINLGSAVGLIIIGMTVWANAQARARVTGVLTKLNEPGTIEVSISVGADDGLRAGDKLEVIHNGQVCGKLLVTKTEATRSTAKIIDVSPGKALHENDETKTP